MIVMNMDESYMEEECKKFVVDEQGDVVEIFAISYSHSDITTDTWHHSTDEADQYDYEDFIPNCGENRAVVYLTDNKNDGKTLEKGSAEKIMFDIQKLNIQEEIEDDKTSSVDVKPNNSEKILKGQYLHLPVQTKSSIKSPRVFGSADPRSPVNKVSTSQMVWANQSPKKKDQSNTQNQRSQSVPRRETHDQHPRRVQFKNEEVTEPKRSKSVVRSDEQRTEPAISAYERLYSLGVKKNMEKKVKVQVDTESLTAASSASSSNVSDEKKILDSPGKVSRLESNERSTKTLGESSVSRHERLYSLALKKQKDAKHKLEYVSDNNKPKVCDTDRVISKKERSLSPTKTLVRLDTAEHARVPSHGRSCSLYDRGMRQIQNLELRRLEACESPSKMKGKDAHHFAYDATKHIVPTPMGKKVKNEHKESREEPLDSGRWTESSRE